MSLLAKIREIWTEQRCSQIHSISLGDMVEAFSIFNLKGWFHELKDVTVFKSTHSRDWLDVGCRLWQVTGKDDDNYDDFDHYCKDRRAFKFDVKKIKKTSIYVHHNPNSKEYAIELGIPAPTCMKLREVCRKIEKELTKR